MLEQIEGGVGAAIGYGIGGEKGAAVGGVFDDMMQGFGGMAEGRGGGTREPSSPDIDPIETGRPVTPEPPAPTPDPVQGHDPAPVRNAGPPIPYPTTAHDPMPNTPSPSSPPANQQKLLPPGPDAPKQIKATEVPQIAMGDVKSINDRKALRHVSEMDGRERYNTDGNVGIAYYDRNTGEVTLQVFGPPSGPGGPRQIIYEQPIGAVKIPQGRTPIQIGNDIEEAVRQVVRQATNQNFPYKSPHAHGPNLTTPRR